MKKVFLSASLLVVLLTAHGQNTPQLGKDPIDKVIAAMTTEEKVSLLIGTGMPGFGGQSAVVGSTQSIVPGAAGTTFPIERLGIPAVQPVSVSHPLAREQNRPTIVPPFR